jgi:HD-like signal output (HDOD) protein
MKDASLPKLKLKKILPLAQLPGLPQSAVRLLELTMDSGNGPAELAIPIEVDVGLTGQILRYVNSSYFGFASKISNIKMAISMVGINAIKNFTLGSAVFNLVVNPVCEPFDLKGFRQDSLRRGLFARAFARLLGIKAADDVFTAALLQDMAIPILAKEFPHSYVRLLESRQQGQIRLSSLESQAFGWTHAEAAGMIARHWNLPDDLADLIESHTSIDQFANEAEASPKKVAVAMSALLPTVADREWIECQQFESYYERLVPSGSPAIVELLDRTDNEYNHLAPILKLPSPAKLLVDCYIGMTVSAT